uniref:NADH-ubiquinone oxidoreductase chain 2 n=1 Tax=Engaeus lengana TaxID=552816 RepID=U5TX40_9EUCA|nr:NADH dehydrogenase subunit 2 [Engaeus lengana]AGZ13067.1 NADH dehydrogenase subunit 2 [Engaeus lengana]
MPSFSPYKNMFLVLLFSGALLAISSSSWAAAWVGLELNLMSFIPLLSSKTNLLSSEAALKYFLVQALGSAGLIFSSSISFSAAPFFLLTISLALLLKMGSAPFHFWFPQVMEGMNWLHSTLLMTLQKLAPMFLISYLTTSSLCKISIYGAAICSALSGAIGGLNQTSLRKILAYSSINHMSWMLFSMLINETSWIIYFSLYSLIIISITILFASLQAYHFSDLVNLLNGVSSKTISVLALFSLGGFPPFSGFIPKWIVVQELILNLYFYALLLLLFCSLLTLYFYLRLSLYTISLSTPRNKTMISLNPGPSFLVMFTTFWNLFGIFMTSFLMILF